MAEDVAELARGIDGAAKLITASVARLPRTPPAPWYVRYRPKALIIRALLWVGRKSRRLALYLMASLALTACSYAAPRYADDGTGAVVRKVVFLPPLPCAPETSAVSVETCSFDGCVTEVYLLRGVVVSK